MIAYMKRTYGVAYRRQLAQQKGLDHICAIMQPMRAWPQSMRRGPATVANDNSQHNGGVPSVKRCIVCGNVVKRAGDLCTTCYLHKQHDELHKPEYTCPVCGGYKDRGSKLCITCYVSGKGQSDGYHRQH